MLDLDRGDEEVISTAGRIRTNCMTGSVKRNAKQYATRCLKQ